MSVRADLRLRWTGRVPLSWRILAVNIFVLALLAGGFFYLDSYRSRLVEQRREVMARDAVLLSEALTHVSASQRTELLTAFGRQTATRVRLYRADGALLFDNFRIGPPTYTLRDPDSEAWQRHVARTMDRFIDWSVGALRPADYAEPQVDRASAWPELRAAARQADHPITGFRFAPDRTPMISAAIVAADGGDAMLLMTNARDIIRTVRAERLQWGLVLAGVTLVSVLLSLFLARTIVQPLQRLARAAVQVRLGRARDVTVPRLPSRRDEIGQLARALSDMTQALRERIDAGEQFAADVTHELKNPLASLRSAVEGLERVTDPALRAQLLAIAQDDILRLDRLITDISEASRLDAELSRARFEPVDLGALIEGILAARRQRAGAGSPPIAFARPRAGTAYIAGDRSRFARVVENLLDNALSFSPPGGVVRIDATCADGEVILRFEDDGPGVPPDLREPIFRRFHTVRPDADAFGKHSGLGLAIARTIIEAHGGSIVARDREGGTAGACFEIRLPALEPCPA